MVREREREGMGRGYVRNIIERVWHQVMDRCLLMYRCILGVVFYCSN